MILRKQESCTEGKIEINYSPQNLTSHFTNNLLYLKHALTLM
jgi:hypothetical protein